MIDAAPPPFLVGRPALVMPAGDLWRPEASWISERKANLPGMTGPVVAGAGVQTPPPPPAFVQSKVASAATNTTCTVTLDAPATAGNRLIFFAAPDKDNASITPPSGFTEIAFLSQAGGVTGGVYQKVAVGGETDFTFTVPASRQLACTILEYSNLPASSGSAQNSTGATRTITVGPVAAVVGQFVLAFWANDSSNSTNAATGLGFSGGSGSWTTRATRTTNNDSVPALRVSEQVAVAAENISATLSWSADQAEINVAFIVKF